MPMEGGWQSYQDFVLKIEPLGENKYRVQAQAPVGEAKAEFDLPFDERDLELLLLKVGRPRKVFTLGQVPDQMQPAVEFGGRLYSAVICGDVRDLLTRARYAAERGGEGLRVQLRLADVPELADWPWELLYDGHDFVALSEATPVVRYLDLPRPPRPITVKPPLRILVTISSPHGLPELDVGEEKANLEKALATLSAGGVVQVDFAPDATFDTLRRTLLRARYERCPYHIWHYIGHGAFMESRGASVLSFCTAQDQLQRIGDLELGTLFNNCPEMRLVLLSACEGARPDPHDPFAGVAAALVRRGVPAVVGMQFEITVEAARVFSEGFYEALLGGLPIDAAVTAARLAVFGMPNWIEWAKPVLYMRAPDGRIFDVSALAPLTDAARQSVRTVEGDWASDYPDPHGLLDSTRVTLEAEKERQKSASSYPQESQLRAAQVQVLGWFRRHRVGSLAILLGALLACVLVTWQMGWLPAMIAPPSKTPTSTQTVGLVATPAATSVLLLTGTPTATYAPTDTPIATSTLIAVYMATDTPEVTQTLAATLTSAGTPRATHTPTMLPTSTGTPTAIRTPTDTPSVTQAPTVTPTNKPSVTPSPTVRWLPAPQLFAPPDGASFTGWNAEVVLQWSEALGLEQDEYYVVRIPYNDTGGVAEFWRNERTLRVPSNFSLNTVGFPDRHYNWSVQVMRCLENCSHVFDDSIRKQGSTVGNKSREGLFYWHSDLGGSGPLPTNTPAS